MLKNGLVRLFSPSRLSFSYLARLPALELSSLRYPSCSSSHFLGFPSKPTSVFSSSATLRFLRTSPSQSIEDSKHDPFPALGNKQGTNPFQWSSSSSAYKNVVNSFGTDQKEISSEMEVLKMLEAKRNQFASQHPKGEENEEGDIRDGWKEGESTDEWEEEDVTEPKVGDGGDGGGVVLLDVPWGERAFSLALEVLSQFGDDMKLFAFKTTPRGYVYVRLDKLSNQYGCPSMEELEGYSQEYKKRLDEVGESGQIPNDLALEVSSPGAERLLKVPDDLDRFKDMPMQVCYVGEEESNCSEKNGVFLLESLETDACTWKLADVKENRDPLSKGRPLSRKQKDWRLKLPFSMHKKVSLYIEY